MVPEYIATLRGSHLLLGLGLLFSLHFVASYLATWYRLRHFKGPFLGKFSYLYMLGVCLTGRKAHIYKDLNEKYGSLVRIGPNDLITDDPDIIRRMNAARSSYTRSSWYKNLRVDARGDTLMSLTDTAAHDKLKAKLSFGYTGKENPTLESGIDEQLKTLVSKIREKYISKGDILRPLDFARICRFFTLDVITKLAYGHPFGFVSTDSDVHGYLESTEALVPFLALCMDIPFLGDIFLSPLALRLIGPKKTDTKGPGKLYGVAGAIVAERFGPSAKDHNDMTSAAMQSIMLYLVSTQHAYSRLLEEIDSAIAEGRISDPVTAEEGRQLQYLQAVIYEGMRINIPFAGLAMKQVPPRGDTIDGQFIPGGTRIGHQVFGAQRKKAIFGEDVDIYRPERWLNVDASRLATMIQTTEMVFGYGRWSCIGKPVAFIELNKIFVELLRRFDFQVVNPTQPWTEFNYNIFFHSEQWMKVTERQRRSEGKFCCK